jgi:hypothetical protein
VSFNRLSGGNERPVATVSVHVTPNQIHDEIERLSEERQELWHQLAEGLDPAVKDEIKELDLRLEALWQALRSEKARLRFGEREEIVRRARAEERLERAA